MALLLTYEKDKLFNKVVNKTVLFARGIKNNTIILTDEMKPHIKTLFCQAGRNVLKKVGAHTRNIQVPYIQTGEGENLPEANSINFTVVTHGDTKDGIMVPLIESSIMEYIVAYTFNAWLMENGVPQIEDVEDKLQEIKRNMEYGNRAKRKYNMIT